ncbi:MAG: tyrosine-type recombinase/integrase [Planctomycetota bacterium]|jgi:integrase
MFKRNDSNVWWTSFRHEGKRIQQSLDTTNKKLAQTIEAKIRTELVEGTYFEKRMGHNKSFNALMDKFMKEYAPTVSVNMQRAYKCYLKNLSRFFGNPRLDSMKPKFIAGYKVHRRGEEASASTINRELYMLSRAFSLAVKEWEWLSDNPVSKVTKEKECNERDRWLSPEEEKELLSNCPGWLRDIIVFDLHTGLRQDELLSLEWSRVSFTRRTILIEKTKNGKPKTLPFNTIALDILEKKSKVRSVTNDLVFLSGNGTKINRHNLWRAFKKVLEDVGIENFTFHDLRHTFATRLAQNGEDIYKVAKLMGHKDIRMAQRYAHHCPESLRSGVDVLANQG